MNNVHANWIVKYPTKCFSTDFKCVPCLNECALLICDKILIVTCVTACDRVNSFCTCFTIIVIRILVLTLGIILVTSHFIIGWWLVYTMPVPHHKIKGVFLYRWLLRQTYICDFLVLYILSHLLYSTTDWFFKKTQWLYIFCFLWKSW